MKPVTPLVIMLVAMALLSLCGLVYTVFHHVGP
jgi:hypothetical protein